MNDTMTSHDRLEFIKEITSVLREKNDEIRLWHKRYEEMIETAIFERKKRDQMQFAIDCVFATLENENDLDELKTRCTAALLGFINSPQNASVDSKSHHDPSIDGRTRNNEHESTCEPIGRDGLGA